MVPDTLRRYLTHLTILLLTVLSLVHAQDVGDRCTTRSGIPGVCMDLSQCGWAHQEIQRNRHPKHCGFDGNTPIVCCQMSTEEVTKPPPVPGGVAGRIALQKCEQYSSLVMKTVYVNLLINAEPIPVKVSQCNVSSLPLIVGGNETDVGEFPHMAALGYDVNGIIRWFCGGSLISEWFVLTAAHCVKSKYGRPVRIRLGDHNIKSDNDGVQPWDVDVADWINHPDFKQPAMYNDIALLRLSKKAPFNKFIRPACLFTNKTFPVTRTVATGWGLTEFQGDPSATLQKAELNIYDQETCRRNWKSPFPQIPRGVSSSMMCAGVLGKKIDTCRGDSGGPIQIHDPRNTCVYHVIGITSFGRICATESSLTLYTRVSSYIPWIERNVWN